MATFPAISVWEPWGSLIAAGAKPFEFRSWCPASSYWGKRIAIHSSVRPVRRSEVQELLLKLDGPQARETGLKADLAKRVLERVLAAPKSMPLGHVTCTAILGEPIRDEVLAARLGVPFVNDSDRDEHSNWGWPLSEVRAVSPPCHATGRLGWWSWAEP